MRAVGIKAFGGVEAVETMTLEPPSPGEGQVRIRVSFAGVNPIDVHVRKGAFLGSDAQKPDWPLVLGYEGAGEVDEVGPGVGGLRPGDRVAWCGTAGSHAELAVVPAWRLFPVPPSVPLDVACALQLDGLLAHALTVTVFPLTAGDKVLAHAASDPATQLLIQIAKAQGAMVIATVRRAVDQGAALACGADHAVSLEDRSWPQRVRELTGGSGCHVVYDAYGRDTVDGSMAACRRRGMVVLHGGHSGPVEHVRPEQLAASGSLYLTRPHLSDFMQDAEELRWRMGGLVEAWQGNKLQVRIGRILPLEAAREGHLAIEAGTAPGKILIKI